MTAGRTGRNTHHIQTSRNSGLRIAFPTLPISWFSCTSRRQKIQPPDPITDPDRSRRRFTHLAIAKRKNRPVPTVNDYRKGKASTDETSTQLLTVLNAKPKQQNKIKEKQRSTRDLNKRLAYTPHIPRQAVDYVSLPRTWLEFQTQSLQYQGHPIWDLCSPKEFYEWTN